MMRSKSVIRTALAAGVALLGLALAAAPASAQRDPAYQSARAQGKVGEKMDGYLGIVGAATPELRRIVDDINIRRRAVYAQQAQANNATLEEYAFTAGCLAISRTSPGEMYQAPNGSWVERGSGPAQRDPRCP
ncbi:YdbL family protein [Aurantiacibacter spongiae]|uniref:DUF1318 domain-containing protein n=1 Tax=Aurantiacibacter spongiae TaxID=2488860 RepID=A0A3N5CNT2_9SPHN|nr:YdbL family protein [Aurantiacibacter spongiae]RPF70623.1 DUF1318 domain-containing protein [Aurantiacibacter spongiae]